MDIQLAVPSVRLSPSLSDVQKAINRCAHAVLHSTELLEQWGQSHLLPSSPHSPPSQGQSPPPPRATLFAKIGCDVAIIKVVLLLTGAVQGTKNQVANYLRSFKEYDWLWQDDMELQYQQFIRKDPKIEDFENELKRFVAIENEIEKVAPLHIIGALSLTTKNIKLQLRNECRQVTIKYLSFFRTGIYFFLSFFRTGIFFLSFFRAGIFFPSFFRTGIYFFLSYLLVEGTVLRQGAQAGVAGHGRAHDVHSQDDEAAAGTTGIYISFFRTGI